MYAWAAGLAFRDAVNAQVKAGGVNSVTRKTIFEQLNKIHKFDADGMFGADRPRRSQGVRVLVSLQVKNGDYVRVSPTKPGTFDCCPKNGHPAQARRLLSCRWHDADVRRLPRGSAPGVPAPTCETQSWEWT